MSCEIPDPDNELRAWLAAWRIPGIGPRTFEVLRAHFPRLSEVFDVSRAELERLGLPAPLFEALREPDWQAAEADLAWAREPGRRVLRIADPDYPAALREIPDPPPLLFVLGDVAALSSPQLAVVGSRNCSAGGRDSAFEFAEYLAGAGLTITSGLALGVDGAAHEGALAAGGITVAVTATGLDRVYPARHRALAHRIVERGAIISEFPPGTGVRAEHFPRRNRIISGLSLGVLVVEAGLQSGSLITARYALEQGREVFAIPGSIHNPLAKGCHRLIRQGAKLVERGQDVLEELSLPVPTQAPEPAAAPAEPELDDDYQRVLAALDDAPAPLDLLLGRTGLTPAELSSILLVLELKGHVVAAAGGRYARTRIRT